MNKFINVSEEVKQALESNLPVVALESTIIAHGMPYPQNVETALQVESIIREHGGIPATIAIVGGVPTVGLSKEQIDYIGKKGASVAKASRRDIPFLAACQKDGATTVAATMFIASLAGIKVFATGGIGGVHRGAETTMDISADLQELATDNVAVVCAGAKSILDLKLTLEYLETKGVPIIGYKSDEFPAFFTASSGLHIGASLDSAKEIATAIKAKEKLGIPGGMLITNPIPKEYSMDPSYISNIIATACENAEKNAIKGKKVTPYLLDQIQRATQGKSLDANIQLVYNNAKLAAQIASELLIVK